MSADESPPYHAARNAAKEAARPKVRDPEMYDFTESFEVMVELNRENYLSEYGFIPEFKAGIHYGKVISAQIGDLKREIVYNGDVVNTTSRIQQLCNDFNKELLISGNLLSRLKNIPDKFIQENLGNIKLRGKEQEINIYSIKKISRDSNELNTDYF